MKRGAAILPESLPPVGISREQAATFVGVSATLFDRLVHDGKMPPARMLYNRHVWDVAEVADAFRRLPHRSEPVDASPEDGASWD